MNRGIQACHSNLLRGRRNKVKNNQGDNRQRDNNPQGRRASVPTISVHTEEVVKSRGNQRRQEIDTERDSENRADR